VAGAGADKQKDPNRDKPRRDRGPFIRRCSRMPGWRLVGIHLDGRHHAPILVIENVAVIDKLAGNVRIAKVHT
jgi:hypothetical protein